MNREVPIAYAKKCRAGFHERVALLKDLGARLPEDPEETPRIWFWGAGRSS